MRSYRPETLEEAYSITREYSNAQYRQKLETKPKNERTENRRMPQTQYTPSPQPQNTQQKFNAQNFQNTQQKFKPQNAQNTVPNGSGKFRNVRPNLDDDVSMRTAKSRIEVNNHDSCAVHCTCTREQEPDTTQQRDNSTLDTDDDEYFVDDELNFLVEEPIDEET